MRTIQTRRSWQQWLKRMLSACGCAALLALLPACDLIFPPARDGTPVIEVYSDRYEYRLGRYTTTRGLAIGLEASTETPLGVALRDCDATDKLEEVLGLLRERELHNLSVVLPDDCNRPF